MQESEYDYDVSIIGAGPSGSIAAAILCQKGYKVGVFERQVFPRFSIGESLLPQCMEFIEEAGMLEAVRAGDFQYKGGANFSFRDQAAEFDFGDKSSAGHSSTFQVTRASFDKILIDEAENMGAEVFYNTLVEDAEFTKYKAVLKLSSADGTRHVTSRFCLDASGFGRVLPRLLDLNSLSNFPNRSSYFTHITDNITDSSFNRERILISVHPEYKDIWYWTIPFSDGSSSIGVVGGQKYFVKMEAEGISKKEILKSFFSQETYLAKILANAEYHKDVQKIEGYSSAVKTLHGESFALLGNAGEFLDPVFSSGVTIAIKSASMAANLLDRQFKGEEVCWQNDFATPLKAGVDVFRAFVESWYEGDLIDVFFSKVESNKDIKSYLCSILAGYAWDKNNPYVTNSAKRLKSLAEICQ